MLKFYKYHGAGNDFILIDNRDKKFNIKYIKKIKSICDRRFGIGADGILLLEKEKGYDFRMVYINADGSIGSMCGNGGRCIVHFAYNVLKIIKDKNKIKFIAIDGAHEAEILKDGQVRLKMQNITDVGTRNDYAYVTCGTTPHNVIFVKDIKTFPVFDTGKKIRYSDPKGINVNFVEIIKNIFNVRTYERGVEDETLACGTGAVSVAIASHNSGTLKKNICHIKMPGGNLIVEFNKNKDGSYENIWLTGPAVCVYKGEIA